MKRILYFILAIAFVPLLIVARGFEAKGEIPIRTVEIRVHHSRFAPEVLYFERGQKVRFRIVNSDPIDHELIVGDELVQQRHEDGTESVHGEVPGEVTVPAGRPAETTYLFQSPGRLLFGCHFPGHYSYGMRGLINVA